MPSSPTKKGIARGSSLPSQATTSDRAKDSKMSFEGSDSVLQVKYSLGPKGSLPSSDSKKIFEQIDEAQQEVEIAKPIESTLAVEPNATAQGREAQPNDIAESSEEEPLIVVSKRRAEASISALQNPTKDLQQLQNNHGQTHRIFSEDEHEVVRTAKRAATSRNFDNGDKQAVRQTRPATRTARTRFSRNNEHKPGSHTRSTNQVTKSSVLNKHEPKAASTQRTTKRAASDDAEDDVRPNRPKRLRGETAIPQSSSNVTTFAKHTKGVREKAADLKSKSRALAEQSRLARQQERRDAIETNNARSARRAELAKYQKGGKTTRSRGVVFQEDLPKSEQAAQELGRTKSTRAAAIPRSASGGSSSFFTDVFNSIK